MAQPSVLLEHARRASHKASYVTQNEFYEYLKKHGVLPNPKARQSGHRYRKFLPLKDARALFMELHPWWSPWEDENQEWEMPRPPQQRNTGYDFYDEDDEPAVEQGYDPQIDGL